MTEPLLSVRDLDVRYGTSQALFWVSVDVAPGTVLALLGPNGAGKSTFARAVSGLVTPTSGRVWFDGQDITGASAHTVRRAGTHLCPRGSWHLPRPHRDREPADGGGPRAASERATAIKRAIELFPVLGERSSQGAASLSGGEQQMLALARALAVSPKLVIADELSLGLAPLITEAVFQSLEEARRSGITIVLSEQFVHRALSMADSCVILSRGQVGWSGPASEAGQEVLNRYLGEGETATPTVAVGQLQ